VLAQHAAGDAEGLLTSRRGVHVAGADLAALLQWLRDTAYREGPRPQKASLVRLRRHLGESEFTTDQRRALRLSEGARNLATNPDSARIRRARGPAGCGKSLGLAGRAVQLASEDKRVLAVTFNITLAHYLHDLCSRRGREVGLGPRIRNITFSHFHAFCQDIHDQHADQRLPFAEDHLDRIVRAVDELYSSDTLAPRYDAVLVDEGQDFELSWWNLLRLRVLKEGGEMLLVADRSQDIYGRASWTSQESMRGAGFSGPWTNLKGTYRMPPDLVPVVAAFANQYLPAEDLDLPTTATDHPLLSEASAETSRTWINTTATDLIQDAADAIEELLHGHPTLHPDDVVVLADYGSGKQLMDELQRRGHDTNHIFTTPGGDRARERQWRKRRFWGGTPGIKGCTVHSFKGWEARAVVAVLPIWDEGNRWAYIAMTRVKGDPGNRPAFVTIVNPRPELSSFKPTFERPIGPDEVPALAGQQALDGLDTPPTA
jgi:superfamily I DNA/RNA helicase